MTGFVILKKYCGLRPLSPTQARYFEGYPVGKVNAKKIDLAPITQKKLREGNYEK